MLWKKYCDVRERHTFVVSLATVTALFCLFFIPIALLHHGTAQSVVVQPGKDTGLGTGKTWEDFIFWGLLASLLLLPILTAKEYFLAKVVWKWLKERVSTLDDLFKWPGAVVAGIVAFHIFFGLLFPAVWQEWFKDWRWFLASNFGILVIAVFLGLKNEENKAKRSVPGIIAAIVLCFLLLSYAGTNQEKKQEIQIQKQQEKRAEIIAGAEKNFGLFSSSIPAKNDSATAEWKKMIIPRGTYWSIATQAGIRVRPLGGEPVNVSAQPSLFDKLGTACVFDTAKGEDRIDLSIVLGSTRNGDVIFEVQSLNESSQELRGCVKSR